MAEKKKPQDDLVAIAGRAMTNPGAVSPADIKRMAARILDDQRNDPEPNASKASLASKIVAKVGELLPAAVTGDDKANGEKREPAKPAPAKPASAKAKPAEAKSDAVKPSEATKAAAADPAPAKPSAPAAKPAAKAPAAAKSAPEPKSAKASPAKPKPAAKAKATSKG